MVPVVSVLFIWTCTGVAVLLWREIRQKHPNFVIQQAQQQQNITFTIKLKTKMHCKDTIFMHSTSQLIPLTECQSPALSHRPGLSHHPATAGLCNYQGTALKNCQRSGFNDREPNQKLYGNFFGSQNPMCLPRAGNIHLLDTTQVHNTLLTSAWRS